MRLCVGIVYFGGSVNDRYGRSLRNNQKLAASEAECIPYVSEVRALSLLTGAVAGSVETFLTHTTPQNRWR